MRTLILGFDSFDPTIYKSLVSQGKLPNLQKLAAMGGYSPFRVSNPPQTEVSWTSIATGADPGEHGIFDFVHRDPATYAPFVSILVTKKGALGTQFVRPYNAHTIFEEAVDQGYPATALWWPAMFPSSPDSAVNVLPGLGTPDIRGQLGVGMAFSSENKPLPETAKTKFGHLTGQRSNLLGYLDGPFIKDKGAMVPSKAEFSLETKTDGKTLLKINNQSIEMELGKWSPVVEVKFKAGFLFNVHSITRAIVTSLNPVQMYFLPVQIHPLHSAWRYGAPNSFVKEVWDSAGPFLTLGWPQDTNGLEDDCISDEQFLALCDDIFATRERILVRQMAKFSEGILASIFDDLDRIQHMFRLRNPQAVNEWYEKLDQFVGRMMALVEKMTGKPVQVIVISDHGFADFKYQFHINRWLIENGYIALKENAKTKDLSAVDWQKSSAYAVGLNSLYINLAGREGQGSVAVDTVEAITRKLQTELKAVTGPDGRPVFNNVYLRHEAFSGPLLKYGPDLVLGYTPGYRGSADSGLGKWQDTVVELNDGHWEADHCIDVQKVPGVLFCNQSLEDFPNPSFRDIPAIVVGKYFDHSNTTPPVVSSGEDQKTMEERLKGLGYL
jgi:predicted AlkP superfamily phosphohydrolase/phosphomutase